MEGKQERGGQFLPVRFTRVSNFIIIYEKEPSPFKPSQINRVTDTCSILPTYVAYHIVTVKIYKAGKEKAGCEVIRVVLVDKGVGATTVNEL